MFFMIIVTISSIIVIIVMHFYMTFSERVVVELKEIAKFFHAGKVFSGTLNYNVFG